MDMMMNAVKDNPEMQMKTIHGIPTLTCFKGSDDRKPLVIFSHAFTGRKEDFTDQIKTFAELGYYAVALDNRAHGERSVRGFFSQQVFVDGKLNVYEVRKLIKETADDIQILIDHFAKEGRIDEDKIGIIGVSMGGFSALRTLVTEDRISVIAPIIASPYFDEIPEDVPIVKDPEAMQKLKDYSDRYSPAFHIDRFYPRAILFQIGGRDIHFSGENVKKFYHTLGSYYEEDPDRLNLIVHENVAHEFTQPMWKNVMDWFQKYLTHES
jgi:pimeloyl-ACP methyl ester carboxylesterase